ncbi:MAG TPA: Fe-S cluster assembly protein SufD [Nitriliruptoraceae bacterium]|nr:Fe-S cluster assembly protein SufD [Nitriliruptoraceae bacterium]
MTTSIDTATPGVATEPTPQPTLDTLDEAHLASQSRDTGEPSWMADRRQQALSTWSGQSWPDRKKDEFWRNTPFARLVDVGRPLITGADHDGDHTVELAVGVVDHLDAPAATVTIVDGDLLDVRVDQSWADQGLVVVGLRDAAAGPWAGIVSEHLGSLTTTGHGSGADEDRTISANDAAWDAGVFVYVPAELEVKAPIGIQAHVTRPGVHQPRILVKAEHHATARVVLEHVGGDLGDVERTSRVKAPAVVNEVVEVIARDSAQVDVVSVNEHGDDVAYLALQKAAVHRDATVRHLSVTLGGATVRIRPEADLVGPGASAVYSGIYFTDEGQHFDVQPYMRHLAGHTTSNVLYKGALQGDSRTVFRGNVFIHKDAKGSDTQEDNRNLILTKGARADSTPFLEIECADITAGHGSATGQIDARNLFYLQARGIERADALRLIVLGFFNEVLDRIDMPVVAARAQAAIEGEIAMTDLDRVTVSEVAPNTPD